VSISPGSTVASPWSTSRRAVRRPPTRPPLSDRPRRARSHRRRGSLHHQRRSLHGSRTQLHGYPTHWRLSTRSPGVGHPLRRIMMSPRGMTIRECPLGKGSCYGTHLITLLARSTANSSPSTWPRLHRPKSKIRNASDGRRSVRRTPVSFRIRCWTNLMPCRPRRARSAVLLPCQWKNRSMRLGTTRSLSTAADGG
jgi:hypothetical protein